MNNRKNSRPVITGAIGSLLIIGLVYAFWPKPKLVDITRVHKGELVLTVDEEAKTQVRDMFFVTMPVSGRLARVEAEPGDRVIADETLVANLFASEPAMLDSRQREQVDAMIQAQSAAVESALGLVMQAEANLKLALNNYERAQKQISRRLISELEFEQASNRLTQAEGQKLAAQASWKQQKALLAEVKARASSMARVRLEADETRILAPIDGTVLQVFNENESVLPVGAQILSIGDLDQDLEVKAELLSSQAVKVSKGDRVRILKWGKQQVIWGVVDRIEPYGFTKFSALGVEEQRVNVFISFLPEQRSKLHLGHGYRVEVEIEIWRNPNATLVASGGLFRDRSHWAVFVVKDNIIELQRVEVEQNNGKFAAIKSGLQDGQWVVLYPSSVLKVGDRVEVRNSDLQ